MSFFHPADASGLAPVWAHYCTCYLDYHYLAFYPSTNDLYECQRELLNYCIHVSRTCHFHWYQLILGKHRVEVTHCNSAASWNIFRSTSRALSGNASILDQEILLVVILYISGCSHFFFAPMLSVFYNCSQKESVRKSVNLSFNHDLRKDRFA